MLATITVRVQEFVHGTAPETYLLVGLNAAGIWLLAAFGTFLPPTASLPPTLQRWFAQIQDLISLLAGLLLFAALVGFIWGHIPEAFIVAVPVAIWTERQHKSRATFERLIEQGRALLPSGAQVEPR